MAFSSDSYNKFAKQKQGTLVGNWYEERVLRDMTGYGRHATKSHKPKKRGDLDNIKSTGQEADILTAFRINGEKWTEKYTSNNQEYGSVPSFRPREIGRRTELLQKQIQNEVLKEQDELELLMKKKAEERFLQTVKQIDFTSKPMISNIGRRVMRTQDGSSTKSDNDFLVEQGLTLPKPRRDVEKLKQEVVVKDYLTDFPISHHTHRLPEGAVVTSKHKGANPFARSNGFTQPVQNTKGATSFQGNI